MLKILIADDHPIVRQGIKQIMADTTDMVVAGEASNGQEMLNAVRKKSYDVILLDIAMPGPNIMDILKQLKKDKPQVAVLVLSIYPEEQYAVRTLKAGASGYLTKESVPDELVEAI
ncbi:MAG: response regulator transcription factor, partial [Dehalococcoidales bacterium]|nr:response regulator transcription factor [Dehalococcoidales bacterium]